ncbi:MAG: hypothetical protein II185_03970, partial [Firmicutes bacterium]|nr:hypothetical protein [Bacillota bacterium]
LYYRGSRTRKGSGVSEEVRRTPEQPLVQAAASVSEGCAGRRICASRYANSPRHYKKKIDTHHQSYNAI